VVIGSETSGGVRNVFAQNCSFSGTDRIIRIKSARGRGGVIENLWFTDISGENIRNEAIRINMLYAGTRLPEQPVAATTPAVRNVHYRNVTSTGGRGYGIELVGLPEMPVEKIVFENVNVEGAKGARLADVREVRFTGSTIASGDIPAVVIESGAGIAFDSVTFTARGPRLIDVGGAASAGITLRKTGITSLDESVAVRPEVPAGAVSIVR
jgi:polygalacturonase